MVERLPLYQPVAPEEAAPARGVSMVQAGVDSKADHFIVVRVLHITRKKKRGERCGVRVRDIRATVGLEMFMYYLVLFPR